MGNKAGEKVKTDKSDKIKKYSRKTKKGDTKTKSTYKGSHVKGTSTTSKDEGLTTRTTKATVYKYGTKDKDAGKGKTKTRTVKSYKSGYNPDKKAKEIRATKTKTTRKGKVKTKSKVISVVGGKRKVISKTKNGKKKK